MNSADSISRLTQHFGKLSAERVAAVRRTMEGIGYRLVNYIQTQKLQGQVLHKRGGKRSSNLSGHIGQRTTLIGEQYVITRVGVFGGVPYARIHEYGGTIDIPAVSGKLMVFQSNELVGQSLYDAPASRGGMVFTRKHKAYTVIMPERSYLRSSLAENRDDIVQRLARAAGKGESTT